MMPQINALSTAQQATFCMERCRETVAEALCIMGLERLEWEDRAKRFANECRLWERHAQRMGWYRAERHCSTMAAICEQELWKLT